MEYRDTSLGHQFRPAYADNWNTHNSVGSNYNALKPYKNFAIQLDGCDVEALKEFDLVIVDPDECNDDALIALQNNGIQVFALFSVRKFAFLQTHFDAIMHARNIIGLGFDGLYIDDLPLVQFDRMEVDSVSRLIINIAASIKGAHIIAKNPGDILLTQGGNHIDGILVEQFPLKGGSDRPVFVVEYTRNLGAMRKLKAAAERRGYRIFFADPDTKLDYVPLQP